MKEVQELLDLRSGARLPSLASAPALATDSAGNIISITIPAATSFGIDGGSPTTNFSGTLKIDFGGPT